MAHWRHRAAVPHGSLHVSWGCMWPWEYYMYFYPQYSSIHNECAQHNSSFRCGLISGRLCFLVAVYSSLMWIDAGGRSCWFASCGNEQVLFLTVSCLTTVFVHFKAVEEKVKCWSTAADATAAATIHTNVGLFKKKHVNETLSEHLFVQLQW